MSKRSNFLARNTQQAVMSKAATIPIIARSGPSSKSAVKQVNEDGDSAFIVGESEVGGEHRVGGTP